jgi:hypothetical protein
LPRSNVCSTPDLENPSASVHLKRFSTPSLTLKFLCAGKLNPRHQCFAEPLFNFLVVDDLYPAEETHTSIGETRIAFKSAIVKDAFMLINLKADPSIPLDVRAQVSSCTRGV